jgi:hypothetical protein
LTIYQPEAQAKEAVVPPDLRFGLVPESEACHTLIAKHAGETEWDQAGEAGHETAYEVRQDCKAKAIFEKILETVEAPEAEPAFKAIFKSVEASEGEPALKAVLEAIKASEGEPAFKAILKSIKASRRKARIHGRAPKSRREAGMGASGHPVGHSAVRTTSGMLGVSLAGHPERPDEGYGPSSEQQSSTHKRPPLCVRATDLVAHRHVFFRRSSWATNLEQALISMPMCINSRSNLVPVAST